MKIFDTFWLYCEINLIDDFFDCGLTLTHLYHIDTPFTLTRKTVPAQFGSAQHASKY